MQLMTTRSVLAAVLSITVLLLASCSGNLFGPAAPEDLLIGMWRLEKESRYASLEDETSLSETVARDMSIPDQRLNFNENGTFNVAGTGGETPDDSYLSHGTWTLAGDELTLMWEGQGPNLLIVDCQVTASALVLSWFDSDEEVWNVLEWSKV